MACCCSYPSSGARRTFAPNNRCWRRREMEILGRALPEAGALVRARHPVAEVD